MQGVLQSSLVFTWSIYDSSGFIFDRSLLQIYSNSVGIRTSLLSRNMIYTVHVKATDGLRVGNISMDYQTQPDTSNEFTVKP
jgi:hypothetical protein